MSIKKLMINFIIVYVLFGFNGGFYQIIYRNASIKRPPRIDAPF